MWKRKHLTIMLLCLSPLCAPRFAYVTADFLARCLNVREGKAKGVRVPVPLTIRGARPYSAPLFSAFRDPSCRSRCRTSPPPPTLVAQRFLFFVFLDVLMFYRPIATVAKRETAGPHIYLVSSSLHFRIKIQGTRYPWVGLSIGRHIRQLVRQLVGQLSLDF